MNPEQQSWKQLINGYAKGLFLVAVFALIGYLIDGKTGAVFAGCGYVIGAILRN